MQATVEITEAHPTLHGDGNKLTSPTGQRTSHLSFPKTSPKNGGLAFKAQGRSPSRKGFLKRKFPWWLKRKGPANSPPGPAVSRSRLCMEATHESPIQAVRKPARREAFGLDAKEDSTQEKTGPSLLRKLWCLKASGSKQKKPPLGSEASPLQCGPVAALSRTADPHGESPLRWKPRGEVQSPEELASSTKPEKVEMAGRPGALWLAKPWRMFRAMTTARAKAAPVSSGNHRNPGATGERVLCLPTEPESSPATKANNPTGEPATRVAVEDKTPPPTPPSVADELCGSREDEEPDRTPRRRLESQGRMEAMPNPVPKLPNREEDGCGPDPPVLGVVSELEGIPTEVGYFPGRRQPEAGGLGAEEAREDGCWLELSSGEDLAELAENPGGQGMVMATRGWLNSEGLGAPKADGKAAASARSFPNTPGIKEDTVLLVESPRGSKHSAERALGVSPDKTSRAGGLFPPAPAEIGTSSAVMSHHPGSTSLEEAGAFHPTFSQETDLPAPLEPSPSFSPRELTQMPEESLTSVPLQAAGLDRLGGNSASPGNLAGQPPSSPTEPHGTTLPPGIAGAEEKRLIYVAAVEIVGAAIDAAAEQLAKKREQEKAGGRGQAEAVSNSLAGAATQEHGWLASRAGSRPISPKLPQTSQPSSLPKSNIPEASLKDKNSPPAKTAV